MERNLKDALQHRRSYYELTPESPIDDAKIEEIIHFAIRHIPSAFNSQSTRLVLLLHEQHKAFWEIVKRTLQAIVPAEAFVATEQKIDRSFASGYGTVLYYEDTTVVQKLQEQFPTYADNFPIWSEHTSAMHQLAVWTMLEDAGFGASLQHYNPLIDKEVRERWNLPAAWRLIAQIAVRSAGRRAAGKEFQALGRAHTDIQIEVPVEAPGGRHIVKKLQNTLEKFGVSNFLVTFALAITKHAFAEIAQLVERNLAKVEVAGPSPVFRSKNQQLTEMRLLIFYLHRVEKEG